MRTGRIAGLARSLVIYHAIPWRQRRLRRLYQDFVDRGSLAIDVGAHVGNRTRALADLGCRVIALEPQPDLASILRRMFSRQPLVTVVEAAVTDRPGRITLAVSDRHPTVTTSAETWRRARATEQGFEGVTWDRQLEVEATTLDDLVARFGVPAFIKIDVEGAEAAVVAGLSSAVSTLSFEYLPGALDEVSAVIDRLAGLGDYRFNWAPGETYRMAGDTWCDGPALVAALRHPANQRGSGDVYARLLRD